MSLFLSALVGAVVALLIVAIFSLPDVIAKWWQKKREAELPIVREQRNHIALLEAEQVANDKEVREARAERDDAMAVSRKLREDIANFRASHERTVGVAIAERDYWRDAFHRCDDDFSGTIEYLQGELKAHQVMLAKESGRASAEWKTGALARLAEWKKTRSPAMVKVKMEGDTTVLDGEPPPLPELPSEKGRVVPPAGLA